MQMNQLLLLSDEELADFVADTEHWLEVTREGRSSAKDIIAQDIEHTLRNAISVKNSRAARKTLA